MKVAREAGEKDRFRLLAASVAREAAPAAEPAVEIVPEKSDSYLLKQP